MIVFSVVALPTNYNHRANGTPTQILRLSQRVQFRRSGSPFLLIDQAPELPSLHGVRTDMPHR